MIFSCSSVDKSDSDFIDKLLDVATDPSSSEYLGDEYVQLPNLYDSLAHHLPEDNSEKLILVERLKLRGFEVTSRGRGNFPPLGARIVIVELQNEKCTCEVSKIYYATVVEGSFQMAEGINCKTR